MTWQPLCLHSSFSNINNITSSSGLLIKVFKVTGILELDKRKRLELREGLINKSIDGSSGVNKNKSRNSELGKSKFIKYNYIAIFKLKV